MPCADCRDNCGRGLKDSASTPVYICGGSISVTPATPTLETPAYSYIRTAFTPDDSPAPFPLTIPANAREIVIHNITATDFIVTHNLGSVIAPANSTISMAEPDGFGILHAVFSGELDMEAIGSVGPEVAGVAPRIIVNFKSW